MIQNLDVWPKRRFFFFKIFNIRTLGWHQQYRACFNPALCPKSIIWTSGGQLPWSSKELHPQFWLQSPWNIMKQSPFWIGDVVSNTSSNELFFYIFQTIQWIQWICTTDSSGTSDSEEFFVSHCKTAWPSPTKRLAQAWRAASFEEPRNEWNEHEKLGGSNMFRVF